MKHIILTTITIIAALTLSSCEKKDAAKYIAEHNGYVSTKIIEFGEIQDFPSITRMALGLSLLTADETLRIMEEGNKAFETAKTTKEAIRMLTECLDSTKRFENEVLPSTSLQMDMALIADNPDRYLGTTNEELPTMKARKVTYSTPDGYVKSDVVIYNEDGEIQGLASTGYDSMKSFLQQLNKYNHAVLELEHDIRNWKRGYYRP